MPRPSESRECNEGQEGGGASRGGVKEEPDTAVPVKNTSRPQPDLSTALAEREEVDRFWAALWG